VADYLLEDEQLNPMELIWGVVHEPPAPRYEHQTIVGNVFFHLTQHVREWNLGQVCVSPADVVLDQEKALVIQPDVFFISHARAGIIREVVWGAPDLVVEVTSPGTARRDRTTKLGWYRSYGVSECWLVDPMNESVVVVSWPAAGRPTRRTFGAKQSMASTVLPKFDRPVGSFFD
jgi:Uma2 family endonuclease